MLAHIPFSFALDLDPCAVDQQVQRTLRATMRNVHLQGLLATTEAGVLAPPNKNDEQNADSNPWGAYSQGA